MATVVFTGHDVSTGWTEERCTPMLRFVRKDGKLVLQQMWQIISRTDMASDWRDVPIEEIPQAR